MKIAIVHDYLFEYGGAERVLEALHEIWPESPIFTAFVDWYWLKSQKPEWQNWRIITSWFDKVPFKKDLCSPLRFLSPFIWESFDFSGFDVVITSAAWYITKGIITKPQALHICYCHTPPRYLYGYPTARVWGKLAKLYGIFVNPFMRYYDYLSAQRVNYFVCNSREVQRRIWKFYRRKARVIYPPIDIKRKAQSAKLKTTAKNLKLRKIENYFLMVNRLVRPKNIDLAIKACKKLKVNLKIAGSGRDEGRLKKIAGKSPYVQFLGYVDDKELSQFYTNCKAVLYLAEEEDFGITPVEANSYGKPVIALKSGGVVESVIEGETGIFIKKPEVEELVKVLDRFNVLIHRNIKPKDCVQQARKFSKTKFKREMRQFVESKLRK